MRRKSFQFKRKKPEPMELDITSLLDILVILLVFLLKSYNPTDLNVELAEELALPKSELTQLGSSAPILQLNKNGYLFVNNEKMGELNDQNTLRVKKHLAALIQKDQKKKRQNRSLAGIKKNTSKTPRVPLNIIMDKELPYSQLKKLMAIGTESGHTHFKLIVLGGE